MSRRDEGVASFLRAVCGHVRYKRARACIAEELAAHIEDKTAANAQKGMRGDEALRQAVASMGDPAQIGQALDSVHRPTPEWSVIAVTTLMVLAGLGLQCLLGASDRLMRYMLFVPAGIGALLITYFADYAMLGRHPKKLLAAAAFACALIPLVTPRVNGAYNYVWHVSTLAVPIFAGAVYGLRGRGYGGVLMCLFMCSVTAAVTVIAGASVKSGAQFTALAALIMAAAVHRGWFKVRRPVAYLLLCAPVVIVALFMLSVPYTVHRLIVLLSPESDPQGAGYTATVVRGVMAGARLFGPSSFAGNVAGETLERALPWWETDFMLTYLIGKYGVAAGGGVIALCAAFLWRLFASTFKQKTELGFIVSLSAALALAFQCALYVLGNLWLPMLSVPLPLLSFGGAGYVMNMALVGLVLSAFRSNNVARDTPPAGAGSRFLSFEGGRLVVDFNIVARKRKEI